MIFLCILILIIGFIALIKGADFFVDGSSALAKNFKVPSLIIGLTIVALGTSAPEIAVSVTAALQGSNEIAISNVVGSNIFNLLCVLGICSIIYPVPVERGILKRDFPVSIVMTVVLFLIVGAGTIFSGQIFKSGMNDNVGEISRIAGAFLLICFIAYITYLVVDAIKHPIEEDDVEQKPIWKCIVFILLGLVLIVVGGQAVVASAKEIARAFGMSETLIGLTIVAFGTSLPELVTSIVAAKKGETGLAVGNVVGSNICNIMLILGISSLIHPIVVSTAAVCDIGMLIIISLLTFVFAISKRSIKRGEGIIMVVVYVAYVVFAAIR